MKKTILKLAVSGVLFYFIFSKLDFEVFVQNFSKFDLRFIPIVIGLLVLNYVISSIRWKKLLIHTNGDKISVAFLTKLYFIGSFFNNFMPTSIGGDVYKVYELGKKIGSKADALSSTFMERFTGMIALVLISYVGLVQTLPFWESQLPQFVTSNIYYLWLIRISVFFGFWIGSIVAFFLLKLLSKKIGVARKVYSSLLAYQGQWSVLTVSFLTSFLVQFMSILTQYFIFLALGVHLPAYYSLFVFPLITLASFFIPSLNGVGVQDALYINFLALAGVNYELALSGSILYHLFRLLISLVGGVLYAFTKND